MRMLVLLVTISPFCGLVTASASDSVSSKSLCIIEKAGGVLFNKQENGLVSTAVKFDEKHRHFILTIKPIVRDEFQREWCRKTLAHWSPILAERGTFEADEEWSGRPYDIRNNIGRCFASNEASIKFFDRDYENKLVDYDFPENEFVGLAGNWFKKLKYKDRFEAGESLDNGPVVFTGTCKSIE